MADLQLCVIHHLPAYFDTERGWQSRRDQAEEAVMIFAPDSSRGDRHGHGEAASRWNPSR